MSTVFSINGPATTEIYTLSLHDALPISPSAVAVVERPQHRLPKPQKIMLTWKTRARPKRSASRPAEAAPMKDRKSTRLNSSHVEISYAVFCLKKKKESQRRQSRRTQPR